MKIHDVVEELRALTRDTRPESTANDMCRMMCAIAEEVERHGVVLDGVVERIEASRAAEAARAIAAASERDDAANRVAELEALLANERTAHAETRKDAGRVGWTPPTSPDAYTVLVTTAPLGDLLPETRQRFQVIISNGEIVKNKWGPLDSDLGLAMVQRAKAERDTAALRAEVAEAAVDGLGKESEQLRAEVASLSAKCMELAKESSATADEREWVRADLAKEMAAHLETRAALTDARRHVDSAVRGHADLCKVLTPGSMAPWAYLVKASEDHITERDCANRNLVEWFRKLSIAVGLDPDSEHGKAASWEALIEAVAETQVAQRIDRAARISLEKDLGDARMKLARFESADLASVGSAIAAPLNRLTTEAGIEIADGRLTVDAFNKAIHSTVLKLAYQAERAATAELGGPIVEVTEEQRAALALSELSPGNRWWRRGDRLFASYAGPAPDFIPSGRISESAIERATTRIGLLNSTISKLRDRVDAARSALG